MRKGYGCSARLTALVLIILLALSPWCDGQAASKPEQPELVNIANTATGVKLIWKRVASATRYAVFRTTPEQSQFYQIATLNGSGSLTYTDTSVSKGGDYTYTVTAYNGNVASEEDTYGRDIRFLAAPKIKKIKNTSKGIKLTWSKSTGCEGYILYRKAGSSTYKALIRLEGTGSTSYIDRTAQPGVTYAYELRSYYLGSLSPQSEAKSLTRTRTASAPALTPEPSSKDKGTYRALLVGQTLYDEDTYDPAFPFKPTMNLYASQTDVLAMKALLGEMNYQRVTVQRNLAAKAITSAIKKAFTGAREGDVSLFYYSGHGQSEKGKKTGSLLGVDGKSLTLQSLAANLKAIPGTVIVILDSCGSGAGVYAKSSAPSFTRGSDEAFQQAVLDAFFGSGFGISSGEFRQNKFYVLTSSKIYQDSQYILDGSFVFGSLLTMGLVEGGGFSHGHQIWNGTLPADTNGDDAVTLEEAFAHAKAYLKTEFNGASQTLQRYPVNSKFVIYHH